MIRNDVRQHFGQQQGGGQGCDAKTDTAKFKLSKRFLIAPKVLRLAQERFCVSEEDLARFSRHRAAASAIEQLHPEVGFQRPDASAERGLAEMQILCGAGEGSSLDEDDEVLKLPKVHHAFYAC